MSSSTLFTRHQAIRLSSETDLVGVKNQVLAASKGSAAFVEVDTASGSHVSLLVTSQTEIWFETAGPSDSSSAAEVIDLGDLDRNYKMFWA